MELENTTGSATTPGIPPQKAAFLDHARDEAIRTRVYELYLERGGQDGFDVDDWLKAGDRVFRLESGKRTCGF
jgi:hypothetical protein